MTSYLWPLLMLVGVLIVVGGVLLKFKRDWRSYVTIAGALLGLIVARKDDINRWLFPLPEAFYRVCLVMGVAFLALGLVVLVVALFQRSQPATAPQERGPRPEIRYAFDRTRAAWSSHRRVPLVLEPPPAPLPPGILSISAMAGVGLAQRTVTGRPIEALHSYTVRIDNTGNQPFRDLPITIELVWPRRPFPPHDAEEIIDEAPSVTPPPGAQVQFARRDGRAVAGTCDLFNPEEQIEVSFYTVGPRFALQEEEPQARVVARAPNLPPPIWCPWPSRPGKPLQPKEPDWDPVPRWWFLRHTGRQIYNLGNLLRMVGGKIAYRRVTRP